jgi:hypothetical protein
MYSREDQSTYGCVQCARMVIFPLITHNILIWSKNQETLNKMAERKIEALEMWIKVYRQIGKIVWSEKKTMKF